MSLNILETRIEPKAVVAKVVTFFLKVFLGIISGVLVAAVAAHALQMLHH
jgi:MFS superfamily sulfate permease-like transporter